MSRTLYIPLEFSKRVILDLITCSNEFRLKFKPCPKAVA